VAAVASLSKGMGGSTHEQSNSWDGAWAGRPLEDVPVVHTQGVKKLYLLVDF